jgi:hypothetical protein
MQTREDKLAQFVKTIAQSLKEDTNWKDEEIGTAVIPTDDYDSIIEILGEDSNITHFIENKQENTEKLEKLESMLRDTLFFENDDSVTVEVSKDLMEKMKEEFPDVKVKKTSKLKAS